MSLGISFTEDVRDRLAALAQANEHTLDLAERYGLNPEVAHLCREVYGQAISDVALSFGLIPEDASTKALSRSHIAITQKAERVLAM